jgi:hypothetical protein
MLKEKDLRGFKKKEAKRLRKSETLRADFSIRAPSHNMGGQFQLWAPKLSPGVGAVDRPS